MFRIDVSNEKGDIIKIYEPIEDKNIYDCVPLAKIETIMKRRPKYMTDQEIQDICRKFDAKGFMVTCIQIS